MSFDLGDTLASDGVQHDINKRSSLPGKIFSIESLLKNGNGSKNEKSETEKEMSTRGSSDGEEEEDDDLSEQGDVEICESNGN